MREICKINCLLALAIIASKCLCFGSTEQPNIVFFITDDQFKHLTSWMPQGQGSTYTPTIDQLAAEGVVLQQQYVTSPVCTPSRFAALTGLYPSRALNQSFVEKTKKVGQTIVGWNTYITPDTTTVAQMLQNAGYRTGFVGKNHVVETPDYHEVPRTSDPRDPIIQAQLIENSHKQKEALKAVGFDFSASLWYNNPGKHTAKVLGAHNLDWIAQGAEEFLESTKDDDAPFFLYVASTIPHGPLTPDHSWAADRRITANGLLEEPLNRLSSAETLTERLNANGFAGKLHTQNMLWQDDLVADLFQQLKARGQLENTIFIYFNDHGQLAKGTIYQGGVHSLGFVWKTGGFPAGASTDARVTNIDFVPTILDFAGVTYEPSQFDGKSMRPILDGEAKQIHDTLYFELGYVHGVLQGAYKYIELDYPDFAENMPREKRKKILDRFNRQQKERGRPVYTNDPMARFSHLQLIPGGGDAEHASRNKYPYFTEYTQLYNISLDPDEQRNLAKDPAYQEILNELKAKLLEYKSKTKPVYLVDH